MAPKPPTLVASRGTRDAPRCRAFPRVIAEEAPQPPLHLLRHLDVRGAPDELDGPAQRLEIRAARRAAGQVQDEPDDVPRPQLAVQVRRHARDRLAAGQPHGRVSMSDSKKPRSGGSVANSAWKASRSTASTLVAQTARTVALRGRSLTRAISPKHSPRPSRRSGVTAPAPSPFSTSTSPSVTT